jgi:BA14K-like protein
MTVSQTRFLAVAAAGMLLAALSATSASAQVARLDAGLSVGNDAMTNVQYRRYGYRGGGAAIGAGVAGLAVGAIVGGAIAAQAAPQYGGGYYTEAPGYGAPGYGAPGYGAPGYGAPVYGAPRSESPVYGTGAYASTDDAQSYCARRYRSYDPASGTYLNNDGNRYPCPSY